MTQTATDFGAAIRTAYTVAGPAIDLGRGVHDGAVVAEAVVQVPLSMMNRHGLVAGATGTGKTTTLRGLAEQLSTAGVSVFVADMKGDLSGLAVAGAADGPAAKRDAELGVPFAPAAFPVEYLALGGIGAGVPVRATVSDFGPQLLAKVLEANETQEQSLGLVFRYADEKHLPLLDLADLRALLTYLSSDEGKAELAGIGGLSSQTVGVLLRALVTLEDGGGNELFGEPQFDVADLLRAAPDGRGVISCLELPGVQDKPKLFSTALMWLLAELFEQLPEVGDLDKPKLVFFFDEAHLLFDGASKAFLDSIEQTVRLIRSKGVGVFFVTQTPKDVAGDVLGQLGNRIQHALRAYTPEDAKALKATVSTFPKSEFYDLQQLLTQLGIGEAAVTILSETGVPTPVVHTKLRAPVSKLGPADDVDAQAKASPLYAKYGTRVDSQSARELLAARLEQPAAAPGAPPPAPAPKHREAAGAIAGGAGALGTFLESKQGQQLQKEVVRGVFGLLKKHL
ncbi:MAG TPA: helicase HerA-like domain-containing protein [Gaiellaceae bacterium]|nr:helicase HerA-like domain-containing protein [Gaiellaceae bacterium]